MAEILTKTSKETRMKDEIKVLNALEQDSKESVDEIAKKCRFSRQKVWRIIKDMEKRKIIWGYTAITGTEEKNLKHFVLLVKRAMVPFDDTFRKEMVAGLIEDYVQGSVKIEDILLTHGNYDLVFTFYAPNLVAAKNFINTGFLRYNKYIAEYLLLETLIPIRKKGLKNPQIKELVEYL